MTFKPGKLTYVFPGVHAPAGRPLNVLSGVYAPAGRPLNVLSGVHAPAGRPLNVFTVGMALMMFLASEWGHGNVVSAATFDATVKLTQPKKSKGRTDGDLDEVLFRLWLPDDVKTVRGVVFNPYYLKAVGQEHWQAAARKWQFGILASNYFAVKSDEFKPSLEAALVQLAKTSGHAELAHVPFCPMGMSAGAGMSTRFAEQMPERVIAAGPVCLEVGPRNAASYKIPILTVFGERDGKQLEKLLGKLPLAREADAQWGLAIQWRRRHEFARANNLLFPLFDRAIAYRYGDKTSPAGGAVALKDIQPESGWLGETSSWDTASPKIAPYGEFKGDKTAACWFPDGYVAHAWAAFVLKQPPVKFIKPYGLGDGQPFEPLKAGQAVKLEMKVQRDLEGASLVLYDGDQRLMKLPEDTSRAIEFQVEKPGIHALYLMAEKDGKRWPVSRPNTVVVE